MRIKIEISPGELLDKISILEIKSERIADKAKLEQVGRELDTLARSRDEAVPDGEAVRTLYRDLKAINEALWDIEDRIREREKASDFGPAFIELARAVYITNDKRAATKQAIDRLMQSDIGEVKSYA